MDTRIAGFSRMLAVAALAAVCSFNAAAQDGSIVAWGSNEDAWGEYTGQCDVPEPNEDFVAVAGGGLHSLGLKSDGSIVGWGRNEDGQCDVPEANEDFVAVAAGHEHSLGLKGIAPPTGACCIGDGCLRETEDDCVSVGGTYMGDHTECADITCPESCPADFTGADGSPDGVVDVHDLLGLLAIWGPCP